MNALTGCLGFFLILILLVYAWPLLLILALIVLVYQIYAVIYFKGEKFGAIKETIQNHIRDCNDRSTTRCWRWWLGLEHPHPGRKDP